MREIESVSHNPTAEKIVEVLCRKTQNNNPLFFRTSVAYNFCKVASMMRVCIKTHDRGVIPINMYAINLAPSGHGKGHSTNILEEQVVNQFRERFLEETFPLQSEVSLGKLAVRRAAKNNQDENDELERVNKEFKLAGPLVFSFDSGTTAAVKQMRHKLLMADAGSVCLEIDEIGSNLLGNADVLNVFLELFDVGKVKQKLVKNTAENARNEEIDGKTPTNLLLYGTPTKLFNGSKTEEEFLSFLETGYARRSFFGFSRQATKNLELSPQEIYDRLTDTTSEADLVSISDRLGQLADYGNFGRVLSMTLDVSLLLIEYKLWCEQYAETLPEHEDIRKAEISHRYFKALKLAGAYAFIEGSHEVNEDHLYAAIKLAEESGKAFIGLLSRARNYERLANYLADINKDVTHVDMIEDLPFYRGTASQRTELMNLAIAYGYKNHIIIKRSYIDGIEFLKGETLKKTDLSKMLVSYSTDYAVDYIKEEVPFDQIHKLTQAPGFHWANHAFLDNHRKEDLAIPGFNFVVVDVDGTCNLALAQSLLKDYTYHMYTTKSHTPTEHRFRILLPLSHQLKMDALEFKEFMGNIFEWLPFSSDEQTCQRSRKWMSNANEYFYNDGILLDVYQFIPKTTKNDERKRAIVDLGNLSNLERWFVQNTGNGNRSNQMIKFAYMLVDSGADMATVQTNILSLNEKLQDKMDELELRTTVLLSASKAILKRDQGI